MNCPNCGKKCYITRIKNSDGVIVETFYCSYCFWDQAAVEKYNEEKEKFILVDK